MTAALNVYSNVREYDTDLDVFGVVFEWEQPSPAAVVTTRLNLIGTSGRRLAIGGTSQERLGMRGTSQRRQSIIGSSER
jgi:hypothetical protein